MARAWLIIDAKDMSLHTHGKAWPENHDWRYDCASGSSSEEFVQRSWKGL